MQKFSAKLKAKVVMEALSERCTLSQLAERHKIHPNQISQWKSQFITNAEMVFDKGVKSPQDEAQAEQDRLLKVIGQQKVEIDFLKNALR